MHKYTIYDKYPDFIHIAPGGEKYVNFRVLREVILDLIKNGFIVHGYDFHIIKYIPNHPLHAKSTQPFMEHSIWYSEGCSKEQLMNCIDHLKEVIKQNGFNEKEIFFTIGTVE